MIEIKNRQLEILLHLIEVKKTTYAKLAQKFEVSKKTIIRDIDNLSSMGIPIYTQAGYGGGIYINPDYKFSNSFFTSQEIEEIILAFRIVDSFNNKHTKSQVLHKLEMLVPELTFLKEYDLREYLKVELLSEPVTIHTPICDTINFGMDEEIFLSILLDEKKYTVAPLCYILRPDGLYLYCASENNYQIFPVSKITKCISLKQTFNREEYKTYPYKK